MIRLIIKNKTFGDRNVVVNFKPGECMRKSFFSQQRKWLVRQNPSIANGSRTYDLLKNVLILWLILFFFFHRKSGQRSKEKSLRTRAVQKGTTTSHYLVLALKKI